MHRRSLFLTALTLCISGFLGTGARAQSMIMIDEDSVLKDASGSTLTEAEFIERLESGRYRVEPIKGASGRDIGYRLIDKARAPAGGEAEANPKLNIRSTAIDAPAPIDLIRHHYLFLPVDLHDGEAWREYLFVLDTGTFVPLIIDPELDPMQPGRARVGGIELSGVPTGTFEPFAMVRDLNRFRDELPDKFGDHRIAGIAGISLLRNYLVSIDASEPRLILRPLESERRTLFERDPVVSVDYRTEQDNIWIPAVVNGIEGFVHYDTGSPVTHILPEILDRADGSVESVLVGGVDLAGALHAPGDPRGSDIRPKDIGPAYSGVPLDVIAQLGCAGSDRWIITLDPRDSRVYFESRR